MNIQHKFFEKKDDFKITGKFDYIFINILNSLLILFPLFLLTGPFLPDLVIVICTISFTYLTIKYDLYDYFDFIIIKLIFIFWLFIIFSSLISENIFFSLKSSFFYIRFLIFSVFVFFIIKNYNNFLKYFFYTLTVTLLVILVDSYFQYFFGTSITGFDKPNLRLTGPFGDRQIVGSFISRILPLYLFLIYYLYKKINLKIIFFISWLAILVLISGERTSFFGLTFLIFTVYFILNKKILNTLKFTIVYLLIGTLIILSNADLKERIIDQTLQGFAFKKYINDDGTDEYFNLKPNRGFYFFSRAHEIHYITALKMFQDSYFVGVGPNMFRKKCSDKKFYIEQSSCTTHPHNFLIQLLAETGLIGTIFYLMVMFFLFKQIILQLYLTKIKKLKISINKVRMYVLNIGFVINAFLFFLPNGNFFNNYLNAMIFIPLGFYLFQSKNDN